jgi:4'-phosphopantetheinyl transferase
MPALDLNTVHVWRAPLVLAHEHARWLEDAITPEEHSRAARFATASLARRFIASRGTLRLLLSHFVGGSPRALRFQYGVAGKPALAWPDSATEVQFNLSHSGDVALYSLARTIRVGVDVEVLRPIPDIDGVARLVFTAAERQALDAEPVAGRLGVFYAMWTRKEAFVKARGSGITDDLTMLDVAPLFAEFPTSGQEWRGRDLDTSSTYRAAVVAESEGWTLACWDLPFELLLSLAATSW